MKNLKTIDRHLGSIDKKIRLLSRINPTNVTSQKRKFLCVYIKGGVYNPAFRYKPPKINIDKLYHELDLLHINIPRKKDEQWFFAKNLQNKRRRIFKKLKCIRYCGLPKFSKCSRKLFGAPTPSHIEYAKNCFTQKSLAALLQVRDTISDSEAARRFQKKIDSRFLPWRVKLRKNISSKAGLDSRSKYLLVRTGEKFAPAEIESLSVHEIETHIFRKENGLAQRLPCLFGEGFAGPPTTEEGLAFYNEMLAQHDPRRMLIVAARTIATHLAQRKSFYNVFHELHALGLPLPYAWNIALRVKRGMSDTSRPGSFPKDHHYLRGYIDVKNFLARGGNIRLLYIGKLNIANAESLVKFGIKTKEPRYLPKRFR